MPRDGTQTYVLPFPDVVEDTTIESTVYNGFTNDVAQDLNTPRPIKFGGTGAVDAATARFNLATEVAAQVVTNYDSHLWVPGSFYSATTATGEPVDGHAFSGVAYIGEALANPPTNQNVTLEARDTSDGKLYIRRKTAGVWGAWALDTASGDAATALKVAKAGDTMTGALLHPDGIVTAPAISFSAEATLGMWRVAANQIGWTVGGVTRLTLSNTALTSTLPVILPLATPTIGNEAAHKSYVDTQAALKVSKTGDTMSGNLTTTAVIAVNSLTTYWNGNVAQGLIFFGNSGTKYLQMDGSNFTTNGAGLWNNNGRIVSYNGSFEPSIGCYAPQYSSNWGFWNAAAGLSWGTMDAAGNPVGFQAGLNSTQFSITPSTAVKPGGGAWSAPSDARIKNVLGDYTSGLDAIAALRPVHYVYKGNITDIEPGHQGFNIAPSEEIKTRNARERPVAPYFNSPHYELAQKRKEFIGLVAQEVEGTMPELVTQREGYIDGEKVNDIRQLDTTALIFALVNAVKELKARIEILETEH